MVKKTEAPKKQRRVVSPEAKMLKEQKLTNKLLLEIRDILDNMWRERRPS